MGIESGSSMAGESAHGDAVGQRGILVVAPDVGIFRSPNRPDSTPMTTTYADALRGYVEQYRDAAAQMRRILAAAEPYLTRPTRHHQALLSHLEAHDNLAKTRSALADSVDPHRMATVVEETSLEETSHKFRWQWGGALIRILDDGTDPDNTDPNLEALKTETRELVARWNAAADAIGGHPIPPTFAAALHIITIMAVVESRRR